MFEKEEVKNVPLTDEQYKRLRIAFTLPARVRENLARLLLDAVEEVVLSEERAWDDAAQALGFKNKMEAEANGGGMEIHWAERRITLFRRRVAEGPQKGM